MVQYRQPRFNDVGTIDCEIKHPVHGWIPFTVDPNDAGAEFDVQALDAEIRANGGIGARPPKAPPGLTKAEKTQQVDGYVRAKTENNSPDAAFTSAIVDLVMTAARNGLQDLTHGQVMEYVRDRLRVHLERQNGP